ncbi:hypothetical protein N7462_002339 [Penicillium macrosclerotiorum]|uniref:uncharacterized protein n=1 Tax=Penicillium macrosclerotiorum TaxID=303699 RepID=UPI00254711F4|nr:uncharacterized protein N7462_002339 [Penicillium macrosclerotiorum]KAJ5692916.1 hypothetical protein N7462_002339 [Penicillium macrosclerotiorum]
MRTRSQPKSPNGLQQLEDPEPRRRRATRSVSAQPQEIQTTQRKPAQVRKTRAKSTRGKKKGTARATSTSPDPQQEADDDITSGADNALDTQKVELPQGGNIPYATTISGPAIAEILKDHEMQLHPELLVYPLAQEQSDAPYHGLIDGPRANLPTTEQSADREMQDTDITVPVTPSIEIPATVLPSVETSEFESMTPTARTGACELSGPSESLPTLFPARPLSFCSDFSSTFVSADFLSTTPVPNEDLQSPPRSWWISRLRNLSPFWNRSLVVPNATATFLAAPIPAKPLGAFSTLADPITKFYQRWTPDLSILGLEIGPSNSALDGIELMILRLVRTSRTAPTSRRRLPAASSAGRSPSSTERPRVLGSQNATPIHRSRTSYADRSTSRRTQDRGSFGRTLYRLPELLSFRSNSDSLSDTNVGQSPPPEGPQVGEAQQIAPKTPTPKTPERAAPETPVIPMTAPAASSEASPGWSKWIFNSVSRKWTNIRDRFGNHSENETTPAATSTSDTQPKAIESTDSAATPRAGMQSRSVPRSRYFRSHSFVDCHTLVTEEPSSGGFTSTSAADARARKREQHRQVEARRTVRLSARAAESHARNLAAAEAKAAAAAAAIAEAAAAERERESSCPRSESGFDPELLAKCFRRSSGVQASTSSTQISQTTPNRLGSNPVSNASPSGSPRPKKQNRGYGLTDEECIFDSDDFAPGVWEQMLEEGRRLKRAYDEQDATESTTGEVELPPTKKQRVDDNKKQRRSNRWKAPVNPIDRVPPALRPEFVPNSRQTLQAPDLSPLESSRLMTDPAAIDSDEVSEMNQDPATQNPPLQASGVPTSQSPSSQNSATQTQKPARHRDGMYMNGSTFVPKRFLSFMRSENPNAIFTTQPHPHYSAPVPATTSDAANASHVDMRQSSGFVPNVHGTFQTPYSSDSLDSTNSGDIDMQQDVKFAPSVHDAFQTSSSFSPLSSHSSIHPREKPIREISTEETRYLAVQLEHANSNIFQVIDSPPTPAAAVDADDDTIQDPSPLTRARNKAEQFKPKTPSRLRENTRFSTNSNSSTPSGVASGTSPYISDGMSIDGTSFIKSQATSLAKPQPTTLFTETTTPPMSPAANQITDQISNESSDDEYDDVSIDQTTNEVQWPKKHGLIETLDIKPLPAGLKAKATVDWDAIFEAYKASEDDFDLQEWL